MQPYQIGLLIVGFIFFILVIIAFFTKKDFGKYTQYMTPVLKALDSVMVAVGDIFPEDSALKTISTVISAGIQAAGYAEELWLQSQINKDERPAHAQDYIAKILAEAGIEVNSNVNVMIAGIIAIVCFLMPHYSEEKEGE